MTVTLHNFIEQHNVLRKPTEEIHTFLNEHRTLYKIALLINHIFRAVAMGAFMVCLPFSALTNVVLCSLGSLFYRLTVETHCAYKFALPALGGSISFFMGKTAVCDLIGGAALSSVGAFFTACASLLPLCAYAVYIGLTVSYDVDSR